MTAFRLVSFSTHGALEMLLGLVLMIAPFALGLSAAGLVITVALGVLLVGLALSTTDRALPIGAHYTLDYGLALGLLAAAVVVATTGDGAATLLLGLTGVIHLALNLGTRYSGAS